MKGKAQYSGPPCTNQLRSAAFDIANIIQNELINEKANLLSLAFGWCCLSCLFSGKESQLFRVAATLYLPWLLGLRDTTPTRMRQGFVLAWVFQQRNSLFVFQVVQGAEAFTSQKNKHQMFFGKLSKSCCRCYYFCAIGFFVHSSNFRWTVKQSSGLTSEQTAGQSSGFNFQRSK